VNCIPVPCAPSRTEIGNFPPPRPWKRSQETLAAGEGNLKCPKSQRGVLVHALAGRSPHTLDVCETGVHSLRDRSGRTVSGGSPSVNLYGH